MGKWWQKLKKSVGFWLIMVIIIQTVVYALAGVNKSYIHMDEAYSLGLAQYHRINIHVVHPCICDYKYDLTMVAI